MSPNRRLLVGFGIALALFFVLTALRLRFPRWPVHPILLLVWGVIPAGRFVTSFLLGCFLKWAVVKYGGDKAYRRVMPVAVGLIAGDMLIGVSTSIIGGIYYFITGDPPPRYSI